MALSFSRPDPSSPSAVAAATFGSGRRGYDQTEVRDFLRMVAAELDRLQEREKFLEREVRAAQRGAPNPSITLDDETVTRMLGEEAARILSAAREAASQIKIRAEESSARLLREAADEAQRVREEAEVEAARRRQDATADAESEVQMAKQQGRDMVNEARAYRERVLSELARRREVARQQIEQLLHGRDRLLQAFERARLAAVDVMAELTPLGEPSEYVNLAPITGPVPLMVPTEQIRPQPDDETVALAVPDAQPEAESNVEESEPTGEVIVDPMDSVADTIEADAAAEEAIESGADAAGDAGSDAESAVESNVVSLFAGEAPRSNAPPVGERTDVDHLFAKLRAARTDQIGSADDTVPTSNDLVIRGDDLAVFQPSPEAPDDVTDVDDSPFGRRDAALTPLIVAAARKVKRVLADEQNEVLAALRRNERVRTLDTLLPWAADHAERYSSAISGELMKAAVAGAASVSSGSASQHTADIKSTKALRPAQESLAATLVEPLRERLARAVENATDNDELGASVRTVYREWKIQRIDEHLDDIVRTAFGRGQLAAIVPGASVCWMVDPSGPACPDAEDNALAGAVVAGESFPTEHTFAPAHAGCRCMLAPAP